jgi:hypothetical protein
MAKRIMISKRYHLAAITTSGDCADRKAGIAKYPSAAKGSATRRASAIAEPK